MDVSLEDFIVSLKNDCEYPFAARIEQQVPIYDGDWLRQLDTEQMHAVRREWAECWLHGAGIIAISAFYAETGTVEAMTRSMFRLLEIEQRDKKANGDHIAGQGAGRHFFEGSKRL